ncbi:hypothetical protein HRG_010333 [Hirsutella rhossiliensis]|uniref:Siderophore biosynthesis enzyme n=1 Tax=Hirsutella rhossiliensis TaxID=111463 RepID=A0A9P8MR44_9HYPO|nr:uncharacterized protein HRG_10333 [Hirsutella rhossiliensis]KAH0958646.1 hypothetical protein HRG_10333 [Hirsutella rhossiliensis]
MAAIARSLALLSLAVSALARTNLQGCTYSDEVVAPSSMAPYNKRIWYVPESGEICEFLDCGGGRAPPKTTVPGCPLYSGTETYSPSFLDVKTAARTSPASSDVSATDTPSSSAHASSASGSLAHASAARVTVTSGSANVVHTTAAPTSLPREEASSSSGFTAVQTTKSTAVAGPASSGAASSTGSRGDGAAKPSSSSTPVSAAAGLMTTRAVLGSALLAGVAAGMSLL